LGQFRMIIPINHYIFPGKILLPVRALSLT
jgi:hypothetical protein